LRQRLTDGARPSGPPLPPAAGWPRPHQGRRPLPAGSAALPAIKPSQSSVVKLLLHSPSSNGRYLSLIPPLNFHQDRMAIDGHAAGSRLPSPPEPL
jgi:hypothetical protein